MTNKQMIKNDSTPSEKKSIFDFALKQRDFSKIEELINDGISMNHLTPQRINILNFAIILNKESLVKSCLKQKPNLNEIDANGFTPLFYALQNSHQNIVKTLLENGADPTVICEGHNAEEYAKKYSSQECYEWTSLYLTAKKEQQQFKSMLKETRIESYRSGPRL